VRGWSVRFPGAQRRKTDIVGILDIVGTTVRL
jgi:hypothetical protein